MSESYNPSYEWNTDGFKTFELFKTLKNASILLITWVLRIAQKSNSTLQKAFDIGYKSLENHQFKKNECKDH